MIGLENPIFCLFESGRFTQVLLYYGVIKYFKLFELILGVEKVYAMTARKEIFIVQ